MTWRRALAGLIGSQAPGLILDELLTWLMLVGLIALFAVSLPDWLRPRSSRAVRA
jgi:hypothetical protein